MCKLASLELFKPTAREGSDITLHNLFNKYLFIYILRIITNQLCNYSSPSMITSTCSTISKQEKVCVYNYLSKGYMSQWFRSVLDLRTRSLLLDSCDADCFIGHGLCWT
jgi:hypothetical protein